jgi:predicted metal-binding protein
LHGTGNYATNSLSYCYKSEAGVTRKIVANIPLDILRTDLERFRQKALELGATDSRIITTDMIIVDERVRAKCLNPKCPSYGTNGNCPPHAPDLDTVRKIVKSYQYAIFICTQYPPESFTEISKTSPWNDFRLKNHEIVSKVESEAFHSGYYLASGLADGPCKNLYCAGVECRVLKGETCRGSLKARYSMESWGMDAYRMATLAGWEVYPIGRETKKTDIAHGLTLGLVLVY